MSYFEISSMIEGDNKKFKKDGFFTEWSVNHLLSPHRSKNDNTWIHMFKEEDKKQTVIVTTEEEKAVINRLHEKFSGVYS